MVLRVVAAARNASVDVEKYLVSVVKGRKTFCERHGSSAADLTPAAYKRRTDGGPSG
jgi:hypothetical protein